MGGKGRKGPLEGREEQIQGKKGSQGPVPLMKHLPEHP